MYSQNQRVKPTILLQGVHRPAWGRRKREQAVVLACDNSGSMSEKKGADAAAACQELVAELAEPVNKDGFKVAVVSFADGSEIAFPLLPATTLIDKIVSLSLDGSGGCTNITAGIESTLDILRNSQNEVEEGGAHLRPVAILFTDGCHNVGPAPHGVAERLKCIADLVTVAFGADADETLLRSLATSPQHFYRCSSGRDLRTFLGKVGEKMTETLAAGTNATQALSHITR